MIIFKVNCKEQEKMFEKREEFHNALVGSPAYINSEIAICDNDEDKTSFFLIVGNDNNDKNVEYEIDIDNLIKQ